ncbi:MAG: hypothetical protein JXA22_05450 [Candidatus Thermoplasmatota archaeon]|nr:hypothetical protein [Candidatus Thermoplasmatota archaeon]
MSRLISALMVSALSMLLIIFIFPVSGNPLPSDIEWRGTGGVNPIPDNASIPIYLKEEFVKAVIQGKEAEMTCVYTFSNHGETDARVEITLPFVEDPGGLSIKIDG